MHHLFKPTTAIFFLCFLGFSVPGANADSSPPITGKQAVLIDLQTNTILFEKNAHELAPPSSMSKMLTVYIAFEYIKKGLLSFDDQFIVSKKAWRMQGSKMFLNEGSRVSVRDLIRGIIVLSGNDAAITLAEGIAGSEADFVILLNQKARDFGIKHGRFKNVTGWPDPRQLLTVREIAVIAKRSILDFPEYYDFYREAEMTYNRIRQPNRNTLLGEGIGCDGLKTGNTDGGGYGIAASTLQKGRRLLLVLNGCKTPKIRAMEAKRLLKWGNGAFVSPVYFEKGQIVDHASVWLGRQKIVPVYTKEKIALTIPKAHATKFKAEIVYPGVLEAPIKKGQRVGDVVLSYGDEEKGRFALYAGQDVQKVGIFGRFTTAFGHLVFGE